MQYLRAGAKLDCAVGRFQVVMEKVKAEKDQNARKQLAAETALPAYRAILSAYRDGFEHLLATVSTNGGLATVMFWEQSIFPTALGDTAEALSQALGATLPPDLSLNADYDGDLRIGDRHVARFPSTAPEMSQTVVALPGN